MRRLHFLRLAVLLTLLCAQSHASADAANPATTAPSEPAIPPTAAHFPTEGWSLETYGSFAIQPRVREQLYSGTFGVGYTFLKENSISLEFTGLRGIQAGPDVVAGGVGFLLRTRLIDQPKWSLFIDGGPGILEANRRIPDGGTDYNYWIKTGLGATLQLWDKTSLLGGVRFLHISNAHLEGPERNPSLNATEGYLGLLIEY